MQRLLKRLITAPDGVAAELERREWLPAKGPEAVICGDEWLSAVEGLQIYTTANFLRLLDCLKEDCPVVLKVVGDDRFRELVAEYLAHPSDSPAIFHIGRFFLFLRAHRLSASWPFPGDLARLERALIDIFHAADADRCSAEEMRAVPPEKWPALRFRTHPAVAILDCEWAIDRMIDPPNSTKESGPPVRRQTAILVWRKSNDVSRRCLTSAKRVALGLATRGTTLAELCEARQRPDRRIEPMLQRWLGDAVLARRLPVSESPQERADFTEDS